MPECLTELVQQIRIILRGLLHKFHGADIKSPLRGFAIFTQRTDHDYRQRVMGHQFLQKCDSIHTRHFHIEGQDIRFQSHDFFPGIEGIGFCYLGDTDVVRHRLVRDIIRAYAEDAQG